jgi:type IV secretory pathway component VirB8
MSPEQLMFHYVKMFNEENLAALQDIYHSPHVRLISGKLIKFEDKSVPVVDFESLKKTGWKYSKIHSVKVLAESTNSAMVELDFSRFDKDDKEFYRSVGFYVLTKNVGYWQILSLNSIGNVAGMNK